MGVKGLPLRRRCSQLLRIQHPETAHPVPRKAAVTAWFITLPRAAPQAGQLRQPAAHLWCGVARAYVVPQKRLSAVMDTGLEREFRRRTVKPVWRIAAPESGHVQVEQLADVQESIVPWRHFGIAEEAKMGHNGRILKSLDFWNILSRQKQRTWLPWTCDISAGAVSVTGRAQQQKNTANHYSCPRKHLRPANEVFMRIL